MDIQNMQLKDIVRPGFYSRTVRADDRRYEFDCKNQVIVQKGMKIDVLFIGDSITQMLEIPAYFSQPGHVIVNRGIGGDRTESLKNRFQADAVQIKPELCIVHAGTNDSWDLEPDPWKQYRGRTVQEILGTAVKNMEAIAGMAAKYGMRLAMCSLLPTNMQFTKHEQQRKEYIRLFNEKLQLICRLNRFIYVDYHSAMAAEDGLTVRDGVTIEGLHPNVFGYDIMMDVLVKTLRQHGITV